MLIIILSSVIFLTFDTPLLVNLIIFTIIYCKDPNSILSKCLYYLDLAITIIYLLEICIKSIAYGFIIGEHTFIRKS